MQKTIGIVGKVLMFNGICTIAVSPEEVREKMLHEMCKKLPNKKLQKIHNVGSKEEPSFVDIVIESDDNAVITSCNELTI